MTKRWKARPIGQEELDILLRLAKGKHAIEAMTFNGRTFQQYRLDDGSTLQIHKFTGNTNIIRSA